MPAQRADARRNYTRLLTVAAEAIAANGADASLEEIARTAGVGSATARRHFPTRHALLDAVFQDRIEALCTLARDLPGRADSRTALLEWLGAVLDSAATIRGLATALARDQSADAAHEHCASARLTEAGTTLVDRAAADGTLTPGATATDLLALITGIALATEHHPDPATEANRLLALATTGFTVQPSSVR